MHQFPMAGKWSMTRAGILAEKRQGKTSEIGWVKKVKKTATLQILRPGIYGSMVDGNIELGSLHITHLIF